MVAIPKPMKPPGEAKSYRPIALLCVFCKIMDRLIYARIEPIVDFLLPQEKAFGKKEGWCCIRGPYSCQRLCMAPWPHLEALAHNAGQALCFLYSGACP